jgi:predicted transcriptional regulator
MEVNMRTVTLGVDSEADFANRFTGAMRGRAQGHHISFATPELLFATLTQLRWEIIRTMAGAGPLALREIARRVNRDVRRVSDDVHALLDAGVLDRDEDGSIEFPYEAVHVNFTLKAAA